MYNFLKNAIYNIFYKITFLNKSKMHAGDLVKDNLIMHPCFDMNLAVSREQITGIPNRDNHS